uniref:Uncharacterized protein n=1 Tax=uncultured Oceanospirillales bacterium HF0500_09M11 TaxID=723621 RepID=E7C532_9GAMM|nr:hypothetical protein [uncultured Oceanospirillales bacterium HF0500_09M11]
MPRTESAAYTSDLSRGSSVLALVDYLVGLDPGHHATQLLTDLLDGVLGVEPTAGRSCSGSWSYPR